MCVRRPAFVRPPVFRSPFGTKISRFRVDSAILAVQKGPACYVFVHDSISRDRDWSESDDHATSDVSTHDNYTWPV